MKKKKVLITVLIIVILFFSSFFLYNYIKEKEEKNKEDLIREISSHYNETVKVINKSNIYSKNTITYVNDSEYKNNSDANNFYEEDNQQENNVEIKQKDEYVVEGILYKDLILNLNQIIIDEHTEYFEFTLEGNKYYIKYQNVEKIDDIQSNNQDYKKYLPYNENVVSEKATLYKDDIMYIEIELMINKPIIMKDNNKLYIEFNNELYYVLEEEVDVVENINTTEPLAKDVPVIAYHFIYFDEVCNQTICHSENQMRSHFDYITENNYLTINTTDLELFIDGKINLSEKSLLITLDDGWLAGNFTTLIDEYQINATVFLITDWYNVDPFYSPYIEFASHTHDMHNQWQCPGGQGSPLKCFDKDILVEDFTKSREELNGTTALCYPFYEYNNHTIEAAKEAGFTIAFRGGFETVKPGVNKYEVPRYTILSHTTFEQFKLIIE